MYILIGFVVITALASSLLKVKQEIKKSREMYKEFDEAMEQNTRAFDQLNETQLVQIQMGTISRSEARLIDLYFKMHTLEYRPLFVSYRKSLEPRYERVPHELYFNNKLAYCESIAS